MWSFGFSVWTSERSGSECGNEPLTVPLLSNTKAYIGHGECEGELVCAVKRWRCVCVLVKLSGFLHEENCCLDWPEKPYKRKKFTSKLNGGRLRGTTSQDRPKCSYWKYYAHWVFSGLQLRALISAVKSKTSNVQKITALFAFISKCCFFFCCESLELLRTLA